MTAAGQRLSLVLFIETLTNMKIYWQIIVGKNTGIQGKLLRLHTYRKPAEVVCITLGSLPQSASTEGDRSRASRRRNLALSSSV